jgi:alpha-L-fucosidase
MKSPDEGMARKEALFTRKGNTLYAICALLPDDQLTVRGIKASNNATVTMLGVGNLDWTQSGEDLVITMPELNPSKMACRYAWTFKVSDIED